MKTFDELFDGFFGKYRKSKKNKTVNPDEPANDDVKKIIDILSEFNGEEDITSEEEQLFDDALGKPDKIEFYNEDDLFFEKRMWYTDKGTLVKLIIMDDPLFKTAIIEKPLTEQLNEAIENEDFEKAAKLRDKINQKKLK